MKSTNFTHFTVFCLIFLPFSLFSQINTTANDALTPYTGGFRAGVNFDIFRGFSDEDQAYLAAGNAQLGVAGIGAKALRPGLFDDFTTLYGYESRLNAFRVYDSLGLKDNTLIVGFPADVHREETFYCAGHRSTVFKNMYTPIWDGGKNGTPVNDTNYYALYIWKLAAMYGAHVKFWEVWNEPGFDFTGGKGWLPKGAPGSWWDNNPDPCDYKLRAPIFNYVRLLRITYEVVKSVDKNDYVVTSGLGFPSFLDAILRNTDNPDGGKVTPQYPHGAGAYMEGIGFHAYPHFDDALRAFNNQKNDWDYSRHSDAAAHDPERIKTQFEDVFKNYGYDGKKYPQKLYLITESHLPRKEYGQFIGSSEAQKNYLPKAIVSCLKNDIHQFHVFKIAEETDFDKTTYEFDAMGLYEKLNYNNKLRPKILDAGIAYKTASQTVFGLKYDAAKTAALNLPANTEGVALRDSNGVFTYVLWAKTTVDKNENASATYSFPTSFNLNSLIKRDWNFSKTQTLAQQNPQNISLTASPIYLTEAKVKVSEQLICENNLVQFEDLTPSVSRTWKVQISASNTVTETGKSFSKTFAQAGNFKVQFVGKDANGNEIAKQDFTINVERKPTADFEMITQNPVVKLKSIVSANAIDLTWNFSDGTTSNAPNFDKVFYKNGSFTISLIAKNRCGEGSKSKSVTIVAPSAPQGANAQNAVPTYSEPFRAGVNMKFTEGWTDEQIADIAAGNIEKKTEGIGAKSLRTSLPDYFTKFWGSDIRVRTMQHFENLDLKNIVLSIGFPDSTHRDPNFYCYNKQSQLFKNMYLDIWDGGVNGTAVNEDNYFAKYVQDLVKLYKHEVKFWEVWNTPGWDIEGKNGWKPRNWQHNWWENNPDPCELGTHAPVQHIVRMMRIAYEVIKKEDPTAFVVFSGAGFPSFLDAILRNTDNPAEGLTTPQYPNGGGAYFDAVLYNVFPHFDGSLAGFDPSIGRIAYRRHTDAAAASISMHQTELDSVLRLNSFDGSRFPKKKFIIGEINVPRRALGGLGFGSDEIQKNFILKAYVTAAKMGVLSMNVKDISEEVTTEQATDPSQMMGLYQKLGNTPTKKTVNIQGYAFKSISDILFGAAYDSVKTKSLNLPPSVKGGAFRHPSGSFTFVLWAANKFDMEEFTTATFSFANGLTTNTLSKREWSFSTDKKTTSVSSQNIELTGTPIFLSEKTSLEQPPIAGFSADKTKACPTLNVVYGNTSESATTFAWQFPGGNPTTSTDRTPSVSYNKSGKFDVILTVKNASGTHTNRKIQFIEAEATPKVEFDYKIESDGTVKFANRSTGSFTMIWRFGDGGEDFSLNPNYKYKQKGIYTVKLIAVNDCGRDSIVKNIDTRTTSAADIAAQRLDFQCFPNPTSENLNISFYLDMPTIFDIDMLDASGKFVQNLAKNQKTNAGRVLQNVETAALPTGIYLVRLKTDKAVVVRKVVKM